MAPFFFADFYAPLVRKEEYIMLGLLTTIEIGGLAIGTFTKFKKVGYTISLIGSVGLIINGAVLMYEASHKERRKECLTL